MNQPIPSDKPFYSHNEINLTGPERLRSGQNFMKMHGQPLSKTVKANHYLTVLTLTPFWLLKSVLRHWTAMLI